MNKFLLIIFLCLPVIVCGQVRLDSNYIIPKNPAKTDTIAMLIKTAWMNYPDNSTVRGRIDQADEELHQRKLSWLNFLNFTLQYYPNTNSRDTTSFFTVPSLGVGVTINIGQIFTLPSKIRQAEEDIHAAENNLLLQMLYIRSEIIKRYALYKANIENLKIKTQILDDVNSSLVLTRHKYDQGEISLSEYNQILKNYTEAQTVKINEEASLMFNKASLEQLLGVRVEDVFK